MPGLSEDILSEPGLDYTFRLQLHDGSTVTRRWRFLLSPSDLVEALADYDQFIFDYLPDIDADVSAESLTKFMRANRKDMINQYNDYLKKYFKQDAMDQCAERYNGKIMESLKMKESMENRFENCTRQGYKILRKLRDPSGRFYIVFKRDSDYGYACGYDPSRGTWEQGGYDFKTEEDTYNALLDYKKPLKLTDMETLSVLDSKYTHSTAAGYEIIDKYTDYEGDSFVVCYRPGAKDYCFGVYYDEVDGQWEQGYYDYKTSAQARHDLLLYLTQHHKNIYSEFHRKANGKCEYIL